MNEQQLRLQRDQALAILKENRGQAREGIELLLRERLIRLAKSATPDGRIPGPEELEAFYEELLDLSSIMFSLGYSVAHSLPAEPSARS